MLRFFGADKRERAYFLAPRFCPGGEIAWPVTTVPMNAAVLADNLGNFHSVDIVSNKTYLRML